MGEPPRPVRIEWRPGMSLTEYAARWVDMMPHLDSLDWYAARVSGKPATVVEFGMRGGVSTWALLKGLDADDRLVSVDIDEDVFRMTPPWVLEDPRLTVIIGDDLTVDLPEADLVLIDSGHEYGQTLRELDVASRICRGTILLHDYLYAETPGVRQAVDEFTARGEWRLVTVHPSQWGLAVLERA